MSNTNFQCYYDENSESYDIPDFEFEQLLEQNRVLREMLEKEQGINQMLNDAIEAQTEHTDKVEAENEKLKAELDVFRKSPAYAAVIWERDCLKEENQKLKEQLEDDTRQVHQLFAENEKLKEEVNDRVAIEDIADAFGSEEGEDFDWESEIHNLKYTKKLKEEVEGFRSVCNEYLQDESSTWEELRSWCDEKTDTIADMEDQLEEKEVDSDNMIDFIERSGGWGDYQEFVLEHCQ